MEENTTMIITSIAALVLAGTLIWAFISITKTNSKKCHLKKYIEKDIKYH